MPGVSVVADDFGMSTFRTDGIMKCFYRGAVSQASLLVNGDDAIRACRLAKSASLPLGLHFNLTEGCCMSKFPFVSCELIAKYATVAINDNNNNNNNNDNINNNNNNNNSNEEEEEEKLRQQAKLQLKQETLKIQHESWQNLLVENKQSFRGKIHFFETIGNVNDDGSSNMNNNNMNNNNNNTNSLFDACFNVVLEELCAQLATFEQLVGHFPFSLDGHHHISVLPVVRKVIGMFFRSPNFDGFSIGQMRLIGHYLPGTSAATAVRAMRYLRVPLPPLGDMSRREHWKTSNRSSSNNNNNNVLWNSETINGAAYFPRLVSLAYESMLFWENIGLFGPVQVFVKENENNNNNVLAITASSNNKQSQNQQQMSTATTTTVLVSSPSRRRNHHQQTSVSSSSPSPHQQHYSADSQQQHHHHPNQNERTDVVDNYSPLRRRGVVMVEKIPSPSHSYSSQHQQQHQHQQSITTKQQQQSSIAGIAQAIIPRRLISFSSGPRVNSENISEGLRRFSHEEEELSLRRESLLAEVSSSSSKNSNNKRNYKNPFKLFESPKIIGNEFSSESASQHSIVCDPIWATECEAEIMLHPSEEIPSLPQETFSPTTKQPQNNFSADGDAGSDFQEEKNENENTNISVVSVGKQIESVSLGPTSKFYCPWSRSQDRMIETDFACSDEFVDSISRNGFGVLSFPMKMTGRS